MMEKVYCYDCVSFINGGIEKECECYNEELVVLHTKSESPIRKSFTYSRPSKCIVNNAMNDCKYFVKSDDETKSDV